MAVISSASSYLVLLLNIEPPLSILNVLVRDDTSSPLSEQPVQLPLVPLNPNHTISTDGHLVRPQRLSHELESVVRRQEIGRRDVPLERDEQTGLELSQDNLATGPVGVAREDARAIDHVGRAVVESADEDGRVGREVGPMPP